MKMKNAVLLAMIVSLSGCGEESKSARHAIDVDKQIEIQEALDKKEQAKESTGDVDKAKVNEEQEGLTSQEANSTKEVKPETTGTNFEHTDGEGIQ